MKSRKEKAVKSVKKFDKLTKREMITLKGGSQGVSTFDLVL